MIDKRNFLLISAVLIVAGFVGLWVPYQKSRNIPEPSKATGNAEVRVEYKEAGFEPQTITVPVGTTVAWSNPSGRPMWVASDPHPAHTDLKEFDQKEIINRARPSLFPKVEAHGSGIYEYTFTKTGVWQYHNHLNPKHVGTVVVK